MDKNWRVAVAYPGNMVFIPEKCWQYVESHGVCLATNVWYLPDDIDHLGMGDSRSHDCNTTVVFDSLVESPAAPVAPLPPTRSSVSPDARLRGVWYSCASTHTISSQPQAAQAPDGASLLQLSPPVSQKSGCTVSQVGGGIGTAHQ